MPGDLFMQSQKSALELQLRPGRPDDSNVLGKICFDAFASIADAHNFPRDFPSAEVGAGLLSMLLSRPDVYSVVAERDGRVIGSNFLWESDAISGVGPITVDPEVQNGKVGRRLMEDVIQRADEKGTISVRLVQAAYHNRSLSLYAKLGFDVVEALSNMQGPAIGIEIDGHRVRTATIEDLAGIDALALRVHGHTRHNEVAFAIGQGTANVVEHDGRITGYTTGIGFFGHTVGETNEDLKALIAAATEFGGPGFLLPTRNNEVLRWCLAHGLKIVQPLTLMSRGLYQEPRGAFLPSILF
jgi:GNAT superfamily N-acetyltransferase